jgi:hypothetical protein
MEHGHGGWRGIWGSGDLGMGIHWRWLISDIAAAIAAAAVLQSTVAPGARARYRHHPSSIICDLSYKYLHLGLGLLGTSLALAAALGS